MLSQLSSSRQLRSRLDQLTGQRRLLATQLLQAQSDAATIASGLETTERAEQLLIQLGIQLRQALKATLEPLCTTAMQDVWGPAAGFEICFEQTASGKHKATIVTRSEHFQGPPADTDGASVAELLSLIIRITLVVLHHPAMAPLLVMDEPLGALDTHNLPAVGSLLQQISADLEARGIPLQVIITAHHLAPVLAPWATNTVTVCKERGVSHALVGLDPGTYPEAG